MRELLVLVVSLCGALCSGNTINCRGESWSKETKDNKYCAISLKKSCSKSFGYVMRKAKPKCTLHTKDTLVCFCDTDMCNETWMIMKKTFEEQFAKDEKLYEPFKSCLEKNTAPKDSSRKPKGRSTTRGRGQVALTTKLPKTTTATSKTTEQSTVAPNGPVIMGADESPTTTADLGNVLVPQTTTTTTTAKGIDLALEPSTTEKTTTTAEEVTTPATTTTTAAKGGAGGVIIDGGPSTTVATTSEDETEVSTTTIEGPMLQGRNKSEEANMDEETEEAALQGEENKEEDSFPWLIIVIIVCVVILIGVIGGFLVIRKKKMDAAEAEEKTKLSEAKKTSEQSGASPTAKQPRQPTLQERMEEEQRLREQVRKGYEIPVDVFSERKFKNMGPIHFINVTKELPDNSLTSSRSIKDDGPIQFDYDKNEIYLMGSEIEIVDSSKKSEKTKGDSKKRESNTDMNETQGESKKKEIGSKEGSKEKQKK